MIDFNAYLKEIEKAFQSNLATEHTYRPFLQTFVKHEDGKVWINKTQHFADVPETAWNFHIGGYQVLQKWLKDRKGRTLAFDDLEHYAKVVAALSQTVRLMSAIDRTIEENGGFPIE